MEDLLLIDPMSTPLLLQVLLHKAAEKSEFQIYGTQPPTSMFQLFLPFPFVPSTLGGAKGNCFLHLLLHQTLVFLLHQLLIPSVKITGVVSVS